MYYDLYLEVNVPDETRQYEFDADYRFGTRLGFERNVNGQLR